MSRQAFRGSLELYCCDDLMSEVKSKKETYCLEQAQEAELVVGCARCSVLSSQPSA
jgi:hypothetical protein